MKTLTSNSHDVLVADNNRDHAVLLLTADDSFVLGNEVSCFLIIHI